MVLPMSEADDDTIVGARILSRHLYGEFENKYPAYFSGAEKSDKPDKVIYQGVKRMAQNGQPLNGEVEFLGTLREYYQEHRGVVKEVRRSNPTPRTDLMIRTIAEAIGQLQPHGHTH